MSKTHYTVLWIPTLFHNHLTSFIEKKHSKGQEPYEEDVDTTKDIHLNNVEISDDMGNHFCYLDLTLEEAKDKTYPAKRNIWIGVRVPKRNTELQDRKFSYGRKDTKNKYKRTLILECIQASRNGLVQYSYEIPDDFDPPKQTHPLINSNKCITHAVYHAIKEFFHEHKFHNSPKDSITNPYHSIEETILKSNDNPALLHYLEHFETTILNSIKDVNRSVKQIIKYRQAPEGDMIAYALDESKNLLEKCNKILGFGVYYQTLCVSRYNNSFKKECLLDNTKNTQENQEAQKKREKEYYQCAINVENALNYVRVIEEQYRDFCYSVTTALSQYNQEQIISAQNDFSTIQNKMDESIVAIQDIQDEAVRQQARVEESIEKLNVIFIGSERMSKVRNRWNVFFAITSISLGFISLLLAICLSPTKSNIEDFKNNIIKIQNQKIDSIVNNQNRTILDSMKLLLHEVKKEISQDKPQLKQDKNIAQPQK